VKGEAAQPGKDLWKELVELSSAHCHLQARNVSNRNLEFTDPKLARYGPGVLKHIPWSLGEGGIYLFGFHVKGMIPDLNFPVAESRLRGSMESCEVDSYYETLVCG
jgi:hypothetical protein